MSDAIDINDIVWHRAPADIASFRVGKLVAGLEFKSGTPDNGNCGVRLSLTPYSPEKGTDSWPDAVPYKGTKDEWDGTIRWTLCLIVRGPDGRWHGAPIHEFWHDRVWTGAPLLTQYRDWVYNGQWGGEMEAAVPKAGDTVGFMAVAGQRRLNKDSAPGNTHMATKAERSNIVTAKLYPDAYLAFDQITPVPEPTPVPGPQAPPQPPPATPVDLSGVMAMLSAIRADIQQLRAALDATACDCPPEFPAYSGTGTLPLPTYLGGPRPVTIVLTPKNAGKV